MQRFTGIEEYERWKSLKFQEAWNSSPEKLWQHAKKNFYFWNNPARAAELCKQIIDAFALSPEADEARLLLHDIRLDIRELTQASEESTGVVFEEIDSLLPEDSYQQDAFDTDELELFRFVIAFAVVALPIIGIASGGIVGIAVPEITTFLVLGAAALVLSKIRAVFVRKPS